MSLLPEGPALSVVVPVYNESARLAECFAATRAWLDQPAIRPVEFLFVDDGSEDESLSLLRAFADERAEVSVLAEPHRGKAATVAAGMLAARGERILFSDADYSAPLEEARHLLRALAEGAEVAIGSRACAGAQREEEPLYRNLLGRGFNLLTRTLVPDVQDTQCGFKLFTRPAARQIFSALRSARGGTIRGPMVTAFDVEVLYLARRFGYRIAEVPIHWVYREGSKVSPLRDSVRMARDVARVHLSALRGDYDAPG